MLKLTSVCFSYGEKQILKNVSLAVNDGECVSLKGVSGSGKTTVALILLGLRKENSGEVIAPEKISAVFQEDRLIENMTVEKNIRMVIPKEKYTLADELLKKVNLYEYKKKKIFELSGGMRRRVCIVRALAFGGDAFIADEVFNGLDDQNKKICADLIKEFFINKSKPVLLITHSDDDANLLDAKIVPLEKTR